MNKKFLPKNSFQIILPKNFSQKNSSQKILKKFPQIHKKIYLGSNSLCWRLSASVYCVSISVLFSVSFSWIISANVLRGPINGEKWISSCHFIQAERVFSLKVRCRELDNFQNLRNFLRNFLKMFWTFSGFFFGIFWEFFWKNCLEECFERNFLGGFFWEKFFGRISMGEIIS